MFLYIYEAKGLARNDFIFMFMRANLHEKAGFPSRCRGKLIGPLKARNPESAP
jgi:hypothetical protein